MSIHAHTHPARNVIAGWLGRAIPPVPKHRNQTRAGYRKTRRKRRRPDRTEQQA